MVSQSELQSIVDEVRLESGLIALSVGIVDSDGLASIAVSGVRRRGKEDLVSKSDRWHIASCNKAMTAALVAVFVERGLLEWSTPIPQLFPLWEGKLDPAWSELTLEHLLSHQAGLEDVGALWWIGGQLSLRSLPNQRLSTTRRLLRKPPAKPTGEFSYSNFGYMIVGAALEQIDPAQRSWEQMMREEIFAPLGESRGFGFGPPTGVDQPEGHSKNMFGQLKAVGQGAGADNPQSFGPAGTVHARFAAWGKFIAAMIGAGEPTIVTEASRTKLTTPFPGSDYAFGWYIEKHSELGTIWSHPGSNRMWRSLHLIVPGQKIGIIAASNQADKASKRALQQAADQILALHASQLERADPSQSLDLGSRLR